LHHRRWVPYVGDVLAEIAGWALICGRRVVPVARPILRVGIICGVAFVLAMVLRACLAVLLELHPDRYAARVVRIDHATIDEVWDHLTSTASSRSFAAGVEAVRLVREGCCRCRAPEDTKPAQ
jgi:hypothetical protein